MVWVVISLVAFFGIWFGIALYGRGQQWSATLRWGGGFLISCILVAGTASLLRDKPPTPTSAQATPAVPVKTDTSTVAQATPAAPAKGHNYSLKDGYEYGYERDVSADEQNRGQAANALMMARFAGKIDGKYQVFMKSSEDHNGTLVVECTNPCEFMKIMAFYQGQHVKTERVRVTPDIIGWSILEDAINGQMQQFVEDRDGRKYTIWFDENKGMQRNQVKQGS